MSRPLGTFKQFCKRSHHDTFLTGRDARRACIACRSEWQHARTKRASGEWVSPVPIRRLGTREHLASAWMAYRGCTEESAKWRVLRLYSERFLTVWKADDWCCCLGTHLAIVYPALYRDVGVSA